MTEDKNPTLADLKKEADAAGVTKFSANAAIDPENPAWKAAAAASGSATHDNLGLIGMTENGEFSIVTAQMHDEDRGVLLNVPRRWTSRAAVEASARLMAAANASKPGTPKNFSVFRVLGPVQGDPAPLGAKPQGRDLEAFLTDLGYARFVVDGGGAVWRNQFGEVPESAFADKCWGDIGAILQLL
jgi:hypothetical protein